MIRQLVGKLNGKDTYFIQCASQEEATEHKLPKGSFFYWEQDGERIYSPGEIVRQVQQSIATGKFEPAELLTPRVAKGFYDKVVVSQREAIINQFKATREEFASNPMYPKAAVESLDNTIKFWEENITMPTVEGATPKAPEAIRGDA